MVHEHFRLLAVVAVAALTTVQALAQTAVNGLSGDADAKHVISSSGSYFLDANISESSKSAIKVTAADVTLDLNGFRLTGSSTGKSGILIEAGRVVIKNGSIANWSEHGIVAGGSIQNTTVQNVQVNVVGKSGILLRARSVVDNCKVVSAGGNGDGDSGIVISNDSSVRDCVVIFTGTSGGADEHGIEATGGVVTIENCVASLNRGTGILGANGSVIKKLCCAVQ
ncbi:MAG: hypothetical protein KIS87_00820 [Phycisphaeraceae bacterium]|nr:hypothetical protein [Phycisphaeraceae bacterium]